MKKKMKKNGKKKKSDSCFQSDESFSASSLPNKKWPPRPKKKKKKKKKKKFKYKTDRMDGGPQRMKHLSNNNNDNNKR